LKVVEGEKIEVYNFVVLKKETVILQNEMEVIVGIYFEVFGDLVFVSHV
jgi:hypothetical protein